ncbi:MAG: sulfite exporter TauE/SafE family protein [Tunicatimonas sp.]|uniref:sulfite exporter TauE/SafE family protein n=1 Tax=Tunicatimonas sp. TaxID=1940096 RepID=UPI003C73A514
MEVVGYISLFFVGLVLGTLGGGGSILSVPILVYLFSIDAVMASAYSLFIVGTTSLVGTFLKLNVQMVNLRVGITFGLPSLITIFSTRKWLIPAIPEVILQTESIIITKRFLIIGLFAVLMILASLTLIRKRKESQSEQEYSGPYLMGVGALTGVLTGLVGAGGGFLIIPALVYFAKMGFKTAVGTTLLIITVNSLFGFMGDVINYQINWYFLFSVTVLAIVGIVVGTHLAVNVSNQTLRCFFGWLVLGIGTLILAKELLV